MGMCLEEIHWKKSLEAQAVVLRSINNPLDVRFLPVWRCVYFALYLQLLNCNRGHTPEVEMT